MSLDAKKLECIQHKFVVQRKNRFLLMTMLLTGISLNFLKFIPCTTEAFILHYFLFLLIHVSNVAHIFWLLLVFEFFLVISANPPSLLLLAITLCLLDVFWLLIMCAKASSVRNLLLL